MKQRLEAEGRTIDEAIERALNELGIAREQARIEILQDAKRGLFGIGSRKARVSAAIRPSALASDKIAESAGTRLLGLAGPRSLEADVPVQSEQPNSSASTTLQGLLDRMGIEATVSQMETTEDGVEQVLRINSELSAIVIGRQGRTLDALEHLVNRIVGKGEDRAPRVIVNCGDYRERQQDGLRQTATRFAEKAREQGRKQTMPPMSPRDRQIVHMALTEFRDVVARNVGNGFFRRVVITPARDSGSGTSAKS